MVKAAYLVAEPTYDHGNLPLPVRAVQVMRGNLQVWMIVVEALRPEAAALDLVLPWSDEIIGYVAGGGGAPRPGRAEERRKNFRNGTQ